ncbi:MAG: S9 family peptidase [Longimicrobiaceae bacterium]
MRRTLLLFLILAGCAPAAREPAPPPTPAPAEEEQRQAYLDRLPPLIDREILFGDPEIAGGQLSPDGRFLSFRKPLDGVMNIWVKGVDEPFEAARPLTDDRDRPVRSYFWSRDGHYILYVQDKRGDENFRVYAVDPNAGPAPGERVPPARDLTPYEEARAQIISVPENDPGRILVGLNDRDPALHDVYRVDLATGRRELVFRNEENVAGWQADLEGNLRLAVRQRDDGGWQILRVDGERLTPVYECAFEELACGPLRYHRDGQRVYLISNRGDRDLAELVLFDPETGEEEFVDRDPEGEVDFGGAEFSNATEELVATYYVGDRLRVYPKDETFARDYTRVKAALPKGDVYFGSATEDDRMHLVSVTSDTDPGATYLYDGGSGEVSLLYRPRPDLPTEHLAEMQAVRYPARDGLEIPAYLTLPQGVEPRNLPVVVMPHGGPWGRDGWGYDSYAQFLANRGYAVLQPNFRGSTGYGKRFLNLGNMEWGTGTMQHDITDGVQYLVEEGIADPDRVAIMGGSYGGYATLAGLAFTPEIYAAGVDIVGPSNIITLLNSIPPYWGPIRKLFTLRVGDPDDPEQRERLVEQSPLFSAQQITAPLLVIQGANDPRVKQHESDQIVVALRDLGRTVQYLVAPDEGHGFAGRENRLAMIAAIEKFLAEHLGGRYQEEVPAEIRERLESITVDPATVTLRDPDSGAEGEAHLSFTGSAVRPVTLSYAQMVNVRGGNEVELSSTRTVAAGSLDGAQVASGSGSPTETAWRSSGAAATARPSWLADPGRDARPSRRQAAPPRGTRGRPAAAHRAAPGRR